MWSSLQKFRHAAVNFLVYVFDRAHRAVFRAANALPGAALGDLFRILAARAQVSFILLVDVGLRVCRLFALAHHLFGQLGRHIEITRDDNLNTIATKLHDEGLIKYKWFFKAFGRLRHAESRIGIGTYAVDSDMDYDALINRMSNKNASLTANTVKISIPEGYNVRQIIALMDKYGVNTAEKLTDAAMNSDFNYSFIDNNKKGDLTRLEGYLFPDTYEFFVDEDPTHALSRLLDNFNTKMSDELMQKVEASGYSLNQILTIASLIEKETDGTDRENIASVIYNRLNNVGETYHKLQIDASLIYGLGDNYTGTLTSSDLNYNTPYNLSMYEGLPPTPIANPGLASIQAALEPAQTNYYFYALGKDGVHHFFKTYAEHASFVSSSQYAG